MSVQRARTRARAAMMLFSPRRFSFFTHAQAAELTTNLQVQLATSASKRERVMSAAEYANRTLAFDPIEHDDDVIEQIVYKKHDMYAEQYMYMSTYKYIYPHIIHVHGSYTMPCIFTYFTATFAN